MIGGLSTRGKRRLGLGVLAAVSGWLAWNEGPALHPVAYEPRVGATVFQTGLTLFEHEWTPGDPLAKGDGLGPVFNERSCVACHSQGGVGGGGDVARNVTTFEVHPTSGRTKVEEGVIHAFSLSSDCCESRVGLNDFFQIVPGGLKIVGSCFVEIRDFDPVRSESINPTALFGAGWVDQIPDKSITNQARRRSIVALSEVIMGNLNGIKAGRARVLADGRIGKFGWKAQFATLEEFVAAACANEIGLGNPLMAQAKPYAHHASMQVQPDLDAKQFRALVSYVDTLPRPIEAVPADPALRSAAEHGRAMFEKIGCAICHTPSLGGVERVYSDFLLHRLSDPKEIGGYSEVPTTPLPDDHPLPDEWKTPALWGVAASAPYFHDGGSPTLEAAIYRHGGDAKSVTRAYEELSEQDRSAVIEFLKTLTAPKQAKPVDPQARGYFAMAR